MTRLQANSRGRGRALAAACASAALAPVTLGSGSGSPDGSVSIPQAWIEAGFVDTGDTTDSTDFFDSGAVPGTDCTPSAAPDQWYRLKVTSPITIDIDLCGPPGTFYDSKIFVIDQSFNVLACNDDACGIGGPSGLTGLELAPGDYDLAIDGFGTDAGEYAVSITASPAPTSNVDPARKWSWSENCGWMNWRDANGTLNGVRVRPTRLAGWIWCENVGWIHVGDGTPSSGVRYANLDGADFGVNIEPGGDCSGLGWGENIGWVNFDTRAALTPHGQQARFDAADGRFRGYAWSENAGWINLDAGIVDGPPESEPFVAACLADLGGNGEVGFADLLQLLGVWGSCPDCAEDLNGNGTVDFADLLLLLAAWGACSG